MFAKLAAYQPVGRMGKPEEVAALIHYLVSDESSSSQAAYPIDGGKSALREELAARTADNDMRLANALAPSVPASEEQSGRLACML